MKKSAQRPSVEHPQRTPRRIGRTGVVLLGNRATFGLVNLAAAAVAVQAVGLGAFGAVILCHAMARLVGDTLRFQSWQAILSYGTPMLDRGEGGALRRLLGVTVALDLVALSVALGLLMLLAPWLGAALDWPPEAQEWMRFYAFTAIFMTSATPTGLLRLTDRFDVLNIQHAANAVIRLAGAAAVLWFGLGLDALFAVWFAAAALSGGWMIARAFMVGYATLRALPEEGSATLPTGFWRFVLSTNVASSVSSAMMHGSTLAVGAVLGPAAAGLYAIARQISEALAKPAKLLGPVILPAFSETRHNPQDGPGMLMLRALGLGALAMTAIVAVMLLAGDVLLSTIFGAEALAAEGLLVLAATAAAVTLWGFALEPAILAAGRADLALLLSLSAAAAYALSLAWLLPTEGLLGAGIALLIHAALLFLGRLLAVRSLIRSRLPLDHPETA
ncbi:MAG: oligosaccharide flippase family protein [Pseudomonadota bacterium]